MDNNNNCNNNCNNSVISSLIYRVIYGIPKSVNIDVSIDMNVINAKSDDNSQHFPNKKRSKDISKDRSKDRVMWNASKCMKTSEQIESLAQSSSMGYFAGLPNELIATVLRILSLEELSLVSITNKAFRDFVIDYFIKSNTGLQTLLSNACFAVNSKTSEEQEKRVQTFKSLGLLLKRSTCLYPTTDRISLLIQLFNKMDGIPSPTLMAFENHNMRFIFQCYGKLIHKLIAGWDDCECKYVFKVLQSVTHMEQHINTIFNSALGARQTIEYYIRCFYRMICIDPIDQSDRYKDRLFWLTRILNPYSLINRAKLMVIIFGPIIAIAPTPGTIPHIGWWDMTDSFFIQNGLEDLGFAIHLLYSHHLKDSIWNQQNVISLFDKIITLPENWLPENTATLLYFAGDDITHQYLKNKLAMGNYSEVAQSIVYQTLVTHKLTNQTKTVLQLIERLSVEEHQTNLINELPIAFTEVIADIDNLIELEDERDITELHEIISAQSDLMKSLMIKTFSMPLTIMSNELKESPIHSKPTNEE